MTTMFDDWLRQLQLARQGPVSINIDRSVPFKWSFAMTGDWTGSTLTASVRLYPDAAGSTIADFTVVGPTLDGEYTTFVLSLTKEQTAAFPAASAPEGTVDFAYDALFTPSGGIQQRLFGGCATVTGKVTDAS